MVLFYYKLRIVMKRFVFVLASVWSLLACAKEPIILPELMQKAHYGALVVDVSHGDTLIAHNNSALFAPASLTKLVTTATAIQCLGPDYVYKTSLSYTGAIVDGKIHGDILVKGSGDPSLGSAYFSEQPLGFMQSWINHLQKNGITSVEGDLVVDASVFDAKVLGDKWIWEDVGNYYGAGVFGLSFMDNCYYLTLQSGKVGAPVRVLGVEPQGLDLVFECNVVGADDNCDNAYIYGSPWTFKRRIRGTIPAERNSFVIKGAMPNPPLVFGQVFKMHLLNAGIQVQGDVEVSWKAKSLDAHLLSTWVSPSLSEIASVTNKQSNNLFAEHLLKTLAVGQESAKTDNALVFLSDYWAGKGLSCEGFMLYDGCGLSRANLISPDFIVGLLSYMHKSENANVFKESLAIAGVDGTFKYFLENTPLAQKVIGKSGGMSGVRCYAGYAQIKNTDYAFCVMVNNSTASMAEMKAAIEAYLLQVWS